MTGVLLATAISVLNGVVQYVTEHTVAALIAVFASAVLYKSAEVLVYLFARSCSRDVLYTGKKENGEKVRFFPNPYEGERFFLLLVIACTVAVVSAYAVDVCFVDIILTIFS